MESKALALGKQVKAEALNSNVHQWFIMESKALALGKQVKAEALNSNVHHESGQV
jgi:hypothetical protein